MKITILTTVTDPERRQDIWKESMQSYIDLADEVVVVDGMKGHTSCFSNNSKIKIVCLEWPGIWSWEELPKHLNAGLYAATGDWVIKLDIDQMFHESDMALIRERLEKIAGDKKPAATFQKYSVYPHGKYMQKGENIIAINKAEYGQYIAFGHAKDKINDLCYPIWSQGINDRGVPIGKLICHEECGRTGITYWNFDYTFKTKEFVKEEFYRFSKAYKNYFKTTKWGNTQDESFAKFITMIKSRLKECNYSINDTNILPKYIRERYERMTPNQLGLNGWGIV